MHQAARPVRTQLGTPAKDVLIIEPDIGVDVASLDFSHGVQLWRAGYRLSRHALRRWRENAELDAVGVSGSRGIGE